MSECKHQDLHFHLNNAMFGNTNLHYLELTAHCNLCKAKMQFRGKLGVSPDEPRVSAGGYEVLIPFLAEGEKLTGNPATLNMRVYS